MILELYSRVGNKITTKRTNLTKEFFQDTKQKIKNQIVVITPAQKATQLGEDTFGKNYTGHLLEKDGEQISVENRESKRGSVNGEGAGKSGKFRFG